MGETVTQAMLDDLGELASYPSRGSQRVDAAVLVELIGRLVWQRQQAVDFSNSAARPLPMVILRWRSSRRR